jgi:hypothetical protein
VAASSSSKARSAAPAALLAVLCCSLWLLPAAGHAVQLGEEQGSSLLHGATLNISETFYYKYNLVLDDDPDDTREPPFPFHEFVNRTTATLRIKRLTLGAQFDILGSAPGCDDNSHAQAFAERHGDEAPCMPPNQILGSGWQEPISESVLLRFEKAYLRYATPNFELQLGDFYASFGRGIVLSMVKKPEIDQDNSLRGGRFELRTRKMGLTVLAGLTNPQEISMELRNQGIDRLDARLLAGGSLKLRPTSNLEFTAHGLGYDLLLIPSWSAGGTAEVSNIGDVLDLFIEGNGFFYGQPEGSNAEPIRGYAAYFAGTLYSGPLTLLVEARSYRNANLLVEQGPVVPLQYTNPPTLEHDSTVTEDINGSIQSGSIHGLKLQPELYFMKTGTTLTGSIAAALDLEPHPPFSLQHEFTLHPWIGIDQPIHLGKVDLHLLGDFGYRHDFPVRSDNEAGISNEEADLRSDQFLRTTGMLHYSVDVSATFGKHSLELVSRYRRHAFTLPDEVCWVLANGSDYCDLDDGWVSIENSLSYTLMGRYTVALHVDFTDDPIVQSLTNNGAVGNLAYDKEWRRSTYIGGEIILKPVSNLELYAFFGSQKAGIVCTGGACRTVPAFTGVKTRLSLNF